MYLKRTSLPSLGFLLVAISPLTWADDPVYMLQSIGTLGGYSVPHSIDDTGRISGYSYAGAGANAFLWSAAEGIRNLGTLGGLSYSYDSNIDSMVVGSATVATIRRLYGHLLQTWWR
jgi:probable HAF family extracellular repeat protein